MNTTILTVSKDEKREMELKKLIDSLYPTERMKLLLNLASVLCRIEIDPFGQYVIHTGEYSVKKGN